MELAALGSLFRPSVPTGAGLAAPLAFAVLATLIVPGWLVLRRWGPPLGRWDLVPLSFATSLTVVTFLTIVAFEAHRSSRWGAGVLLSGGVVLALFEALRPRRPRAGDAPMLAPAPSPDRPRRTLQGVVLVGLALLFWTLLTVGGTRNPRSVADLQEEALHLSILRKITENASLDHTNVMYKAGAVNTYVYPPYHFGLALVSHVSGLDPVIVYLGFRPVAALVALLAMRALAGALFAHPWVPDLSLLAWLVLVATNAAGQVPRYFWAQLVPLSHLGDFGLGVMYPLLLLVTFRFLSAPRRWGPLTAALLGAALLVHTREVLQLLVFLGAAAAYALTIPDPPWRRRLAALVAIVLALGLTYRWLHASLATHAVEFEAANRAAFAAQFERVLARPLPEVLGEANPTRYRLNARGVFLLPLVVLPFLWLVRRPWAWFAAPGLLAMAMITRIPYLTFPFILATYAEMLQTPARYFVHWGYLLLGGGYAMAVLLLVRAHEHVRGRARTPAGRAAATGAAVLAAVSGGAGLVLGLRILERTAVAAVDLLYLVAVAGSALALATRRFLARVGPAAVPTRPGWMAFLLAVAAASPLLKYDYPPTLRQQYVEWRSLPSGADFWDWYAATDYAPRLPGSVVRFLRDEVPAGSVIAAPNRFAYAIAVFTNHHIVSWGYFLSTELDIVGAHERVTGERRAFPPDPVQGYLGRARYAQEVIDREPLFSPAVPPEQTLAYLEAYGVEYVVAGPLQRARYERLAASHPSRLEPVYTRREFGVFRVRPDPAPMAGGRSH